MPVSLIHTGWGFRGNGGRLGSTDISAYYNGTEMLRMSATVLTLRAGDLVIADTFGLNIGSATQVTVSDGDGATDMIPELQVLGTGAADGSALVAAFNTTNTRAVAPHIVLVKGAAATQVATTAVADNEVVGAIVAYGSDSADFETPVASIEFVVDDVGGPGAGAIGGSIEFFCTADGGETLTNRMTLSNVGALTVGGANSAAETAFIFRNTSNDASAGSEVRVSIGGSLATGDAKFSAIETGSHELVIGIDVSASIAAMSMSATLGTNDILRITDATPPVITYNTTHPTGTFDYVCDFCGRHGGEPFQCHGAAALWHDDLQALVPVLRWADKPMVPETLRHMEKIGVFDLRQSGNELEPWVGINLVAAQWFTWSAMKQMYNDIQAIKEKVGV